MNKLSREKMCKKKKKEILRILLPPIFTFLLNSVVYWSAPLIKTGIAAHNLSSSVYRLVPFMPQFIMDAIYSGLWIIYSLRRRKRNTGINFLLLTFMRGWSVLSVLYFSQLQIQDRNLQAVTSLLVQFVSCTRLTSR